MIKVLHNNSCSKSRAILEYLDENNAEFELIDFIKNPLSKVELLTVLKKLNSSPKNIVRFKDAEFQSLHLNLDELSEDETIDLLTKHPNLIQRPILIKGKIAIIGRPLENVKLFVNE